MAFPSASIEAAYVKLSTLSIHNKLFVGVLNDGTVGAVLTTGGGVGVSPPPHDPILKLELVYKLYFSFSIIYHYSLIQKLEQVLLFHYFKCYRLFC